MQSASLGVTSNLASASGFERTITNTLVQSTVAGSIGRDVASTAIGTAVSSTMLESNIKVGKAFFDKIALEEIAKDQNSAKYFTPEEMDAIKIGVVLPSVHRKIAAELTKNIEPPLQGLP